MNKRSHNLRFSICSGQNKIARAGMIHPQTRPAQTQNPTTIATRANKIKREWTLSTVLSSRGGPGPGSGRGGGGETAREGNGRRGTGEEEDHLPPAGVRFPRGGVLHFGRRGREQRKPSCSAARCCWTWRVWGRRPSHCPRGRRDANKMEDEIMIHERTWLVGTRSSTALPSPCAMGRISNVRRGSYGSCEKSNIYCARLIFGPRAKGPSQPKSHFLPLARLRRHLYLCAIKKIAHTCVLLKR
jgi:hypothetical protein